LSGKLGDVAIQNSLGDVIEEFIGEEQGMKVKGPGKKWSMSFKGRAINAMWPIAHDWSAETFVITVNAGGQGRVRTAPAM